MTVEPNVINSKFGSSTWIPKWQRKARHADGPCSGGCGECEPDEYYAWDDQPDYWEPPSHFTGLL